MTPDRLRSLTLSFLGLAALGGCGHHAAPAAAPQPVLVSTVHLRDGAGVRRIAGVVMARHAATLGFQVGGRVVARLVEVGQSVRAGQALARLDGADYALSAAAAADQLGAARAAAAQAASDAARLGRLAGSGAVAPADRERQRSEADAAAARAGAAASQLALARRQVADAVLVAPFDGVVTAVDVEVGQVVAAGQPVLGIAQRGEPEVVADLPADAASGAASAAASASYFDLPGVRTPLRLRELAPQASGGSWRARYALRAPAPAGLRLGMAATLELRGGGAVAVAALPAQALMQEAGQARVWRIDAGGQHVVAQPVAVLGYDDDVVFVAGLHDGDRIVSAGVQKLDPGLAIAPQERSGDGLNTGVAQAAGGAR
jgi:RND family efflux transporter MFP subunit